MNGNINTILAELRKKAMALPEKPGVYIMHDKSDKIIYIGKAKILKNRVSQYFGSPTNHTDKVRQMVSNVNRFEYIVCDSEFEALILECSLIKQHQPKYNVLLKDDKGYHYIKVTDGLWPKISSVMQIENDGSQYLGPYNSSWVVKQTVNEATKIFKLPKCNKIFPRDINKSRPCLNFHIGACSAPCAGKISQSEYISTVNEAIDFIKGGSKLNINQLHTEMDNAAENLEFEKAARIRDRIRAIQKIKEKQKVILSTYENQDVVSFVSDENITAVELFVFRNSRLCDRKQFILDNYDTASSLRSSFLKQYYSSQEEVPKRILLDEPCDDMEMLSEYFSKRMARKVEIVIPKIGEQKHLIEMCRNNALQYLADRTGRRGHEVAALDELKKLLNLENLPKYIESYDISHTAGSENVAGMVVFKNGRPYKTAYKKFKIKSFEGQDDCRSMQEVVERRFNEYFKGEDEGFKTLPDLILLDGGHTQLNAVLNVLNRLDITIPVFGMVKDGKHKTNAIATNGGTIAIKSNRLAFTLLSNIQEEVHRFAIGYHRSRSSKSMLTSELTAIDGVGKATADKLLKHFKTISKIKAASVDALAGVKGVSKKVAENIYMYFNTEG